MRAIAFNDESGRRWEIVVNVPVRDRVRDRLGVDVLKLFDLDEAFRVLTDPSLLVKVLFVLIEPQAAAAGVTADDFGAAMVGDAIERGADALLEGVAEFFPKAKAERLRQIKREGEKAAADLLARLTRYIEELSTGAASADH